MIYFFYSDVFKSFLEADSHFCVKEEENMHNFHGLL
jgi:hypothetical protein